MSGRASRSGAPSHVETYSPRRRTALLLSGTGTAGAYHAGVLRALQEAGVKLDVVAGRGMGVVGALLAAVDGPQRLWDERGFWRTRAVTGLYPWRLVLRLMAGGVAAAVVLTLAPLLFLVAGLAVFPLDFLLKLVGVTAAGGLVASYVAVAQAALEPTALPTWLPRLAMLVLGAAAASALVAAYLNAGPRRERGAAWWRIVPPPLTAGPAADHCWAIVWDLLRGAAQLKPPPPREVARRYIELLSENLGQPGFRELLIAVHDIDAGRDLVFGLVAEGRRRDLVRRATTREAEARRAEVLDLSGVARDHLVDAVAAALSVPLATGPHTIAFASDAYWRGESHRLCDRPAALGRVIEELTELGVEQVILVSAAPEAAGPHALSPPRLDGRGRLGEYLQSSETAVVRDLGTIWAGATPRVFTIRPAHNPVGPFDFGGGFDDRSDRRQPIGELMSRGYEDAYHQFIEPVVGASGERVGQGV